MNEIVIDYLLMARAGRMEEAFHGLVELADDPFSTLRDAYRAETNPEIRALLVHVIWQRRQPSTVPFLAEALDDQDPEALKQALDGLCTIGNEDALRALINASDHVDEERRCWIAEAIDEWEGEGKLATRK